MRGQACCISFIIIYLALVSSTMTDKGKDNPFNLMTDKGKDNPSNLMTDKKGYLSPMTDNKGHHFNPFHAERAYAVISRAPLDPNRENFKTALKVVPCSFSPGRCSSNVSWGSFDDRINETGWSFLSITTNGEYDDLIQAYSAGLLEGQLTYSRGYEYIINVLNGQTNYSPELANFITTNINWMKTQISSNPSDPYWHQINLLFSQLDGIYDGYIQTCSGNQKFSKDIFYAVQLSGEIGDLCGAYGCTGQLGQRRKHTGNSHCSALIKVLNNMEDIIAGHTTWAPYVLMTRVYKTYDFSFHTAPGVKKIIPGKRIFFSSYPLTLYSVDDFYQINNGLVVTETTIENYNDTLWKYVQPIGQVPNWMRNMLANRISTDGKSWMENYKQYNSGTYNNEWMVLDYNKFIPKQDLLPGTLYVGEQMPGYFVYSDMTDWLKTKSHWASYNRPFYPEIYDISGQGDMEKSEGDHYSWSKTSRAVLFQKLQGTVIDEMTFRNVIRYNNFQFDTIATQGCSNGRSASNAISERGDLTPADAGCIEDIAQQNEGGIDSKYTNYQMMMGNILTVVAQSGPSYDTQPPFVWSTSPFADASHIGQPDIFQFPWGLITSE